MWWIRIGSCRISRGLRGMRRCRHRQLTSTSAVAKATANSEDDGIGTVAAAAAAAEQSSFYEHYDSSSLPAHYNLYPDSDDEVLSKIWKADSVDEIMETFASSQQRRTWRHSAQALASLYLVQKQPVRYFDLTNNEQIQNHSLYPKITELIYRHFEEIPLSTLCLLFFFMRRLGHELHEKNIMDISLRIRRNLDKLEVSSLSYFFTGIRYSKRRDISLRLILYLCEGMPVLSEHIDKAETTDDVYRISDCLYSSYRIASQEMLDKFEAKSQMILDSPHFEERVVQALIKFIRLLQLMNMQKHVFKYSRRLSTLCRGNVHRLPFLYVRSLANIWFTTGELENIRDEIIDVLKKDYAETDHSIYKIFGLVKILGLQNGTCSEETWNEFFRDAKSFSPSNSFTFEGLATSLIILSTYVDFKDGTNFRRLISDIKEEMPLTNISYLIFRGKTTGKYYQLSALESFCVEAAQKKILETFCPSQFAFLFSEIMRSVRDDLPQEIMDKFYNMVPQFNIHSIALIIKRLSSRCREDLPQSLLDRFEEIEDSLIKVILKMTEDEETLMDPNMLKVLSDLSGKYLDLEKLRRSVDEIFERILNSPDELSPQVRVFILSCIEKLRVYPEKDLHSRMLDRLIDDVVKYEYRHVNYLPYLLNICFTLNHRISPQNFDKFFDIVTAAVMKNLDFYQPKQVIEMGLSLILYKKLSKEIARGIFSLEFLDKIDKTERGPTSYGRHCLMRLNRSVHLLYPEYGIPWFHHKYCMEWGSFFPKINGLGTVVYNSLLSYLGDYRYIAENVFTKYFSKIDYEIVLDKERKPVIPEKALSTWKVAVGRDFKSLRKFAVILPHPKESAGDLCIRRKELETQGYEVIVVDGSLWKSMKMSDELSQREFWKKTMPIKM